MHARTRMYQILNLKDAHARTRMYQILNLKDAHALCQELALHIEKLMKHITNKNFVTLVGTGF